MRVFVPGATGHMGRAIVKALQGRGHKVVGLARSDQAAHALEEMGAQVCRGDLTDPASLVTCAKRAGGVINVARAPELDVAGRASAALLKALAGSGKPLVVTTGSNIYGDTGSAPATEEAPARPPAGEFLAAYERPVLAATGIRTVIIRPGFVYGGAGAPSTQALLRLTRQANYGCYIGAGDERWSFVHVTDLADMYVRALEEAPAGSVFNAAAEPAVTVKELARALSLAADCGGRTRSYTPEEAVSLLGERATALLSRNKWICAQKATELLGWTPRCPSVLDDLAALT